MTSRSPTGADLVGYSRTNHLNIKKRGFGGKKGKSHEGLRTNNAG